MAVTSTKKKPTIQDVAKHAKVSTATVSRALSNPERVSEATRERVSKAVHSTGYTINQAARSLRLRAARTIVIAFPNIGNPFYSTVLDAVVRETSSRGYGALVANRLGDNPTRWLRDYFLSSRADGMVLFDASLDAQQLQDLRSPQGKFPLVVACDELPDARLHSVMTDNRAAAARATRYLIDLGHRRIGHIHSPSRNPTLLSDRLLGFRDAMAGAQLEVLPEWILPGDFTMASGEAAGRAFLALQKQPTAIFSANDEMAIGFLSVLRSAGIQCPKDISLVGFDDITVARCIDPPLTTMRQPREEVGRLATKLLLDVLESQTQPRTPVHLVLKSELVVRESAAPCDRP
ncbi:MAG: LacI family DNA-binding transcriptional regulator [Devosia sp.]|nr:LacI family DNA-binding transcriptional regulator [Devosia sp.]